MYTILLNSDNTITVTNKERIMQYSKLVDTLQFLSPKKYEDIELEKMSVILQYVTPISKEVKLVELQLADKDYKENYLQYKLPIDTDITKENGLVEMFVSFKASVMDTNGNVTQYNRNTDAFSIEVIPVKNWFTVPDSALDTLTQMYLANQQIANALLDAQARTYVNKADNIELDADNGYLWLVSGTKRIGDPIKISELGDTLAELTEKGLVKVLN